MSKYQHKKKEKEIIPKKEYTEAEIKAELVKQKKYYEKGQWTVRSWIRWYHGYGAVRILDIEHNSFSVILPNFEQIREFENQINAYIRKEEGIEKLKVEGLEELVKGTKYE